MMTVVPMPERDWRDRLQRSTTHALKKNLHNAAVALRWAPELAGLVLLDEFAGRVEVARETPWGARAGAAWSDRDTLALADWLQSNGPEIAPPTAEQAVELVAHENRRHPVRDWLDGLEWDKERRLDDWLNTYLGAPYEGREHMAYVRAVGARWMISAVARAVDAPCQVDTAIILEGEQGAGKSTAARTLAGNEWFADQLADMGSKDSSQDLRGKWVVELGELAAMRGPDVEKVKAFMSRQVDHYRPSYGKRSVDVPRQCVFIGSTNRDDYLHDETGNRRFWPVRVGEINVPLLRDHRRQLWAEAAHRHRAGEEWWLGGELADFAAREQAARLQRDPWHDAIVDWLDRQTLKEHAIPDILRLALDFRTQDMGQREMNRVSRVLRVAGWERERVRVGGVRSWIYRKAKAKARP